MSDSQLIGVVDDSRFEDHHAAGAHPERPERLVAARRGLLSAVPETQRQALPMREVEHEELLRTHTRDYLEALQAALARGNGQLDPDTFFSSGTKTAAWLAAGSCVELTRALAAGRLGGAVALVRPPGHHAEPSRAMGFCLLNNVAIAAADALQRGASRVAIIDWDVHHGNGTQHMFEADPRVLYVSTHQAPFYPGTGGAAEIGTGRGEGFTANIPLPSGSDASSYGAAFREIVLPLLDAYQPELVLVSAGFDAHARDPLAGMSLETKDYGAMTSALLQHCRDAGHRRLGLVLEGGYDLEGLEGGMAAAGRALMGEWTPLASEEPPPAARRQLEASRHSLVPYWPTLRT